MLSQKKYVLLNAYHIMNDGFFDAVPVLLTFVALAYGLGEKEIGMVVSCGTALGTVTGLATMFLSRYLSPLKTISLLIGVGGAGFVAASFSPGFLFAGISFTVVMFGYSLFHNICFSYLTVHTERKKLGRILSDFAAIGDIGRIPFIAIAGYLSAFTFFNVSGWKLVSFFFGIVGLVSAVLLFLFSKEDAVEERFVHAGSSIPSFNILQDRSVILSMAASILNTFGNEKIFTFLPMLILFKGFDPGIVGTFAVGFTVGSFLGKMACGRLLDRYDPKIVFIVAESVLSLFLFLIIYSTSLSVIMFFAFFIGLLTKGTVPVIQAIITVPFQDIGDYDKIFSINSFVRGIINIFTPLLFGVIASIWNINVVYVIMAAASFLAVVPMLYFNMAARITTGHDRK